MRGLDLYIEIGAKCYKMRKFGQSFNLIAIILNVTQSQARSACAWFTNRPFAVKEKQLKNK